MKFLHTADWQIGQIFHDYDHADELQQFLDWLSNLLKSHHFDFLLVSGDVFDYSNPSATSIKMFYSFLNKAVRTNSDLQIIVTAGNHDSVARFESPRPLLESSNMDIIGVGEKKSDNNIDYEELIIPLRDKKW